MVTFREFYDTLEQSISQAANGTNIMRGQFDKITVSAPACVLFIAPDGFDAASEWMRNGLGYVYCIAAAEADATGAYLNSVVIAESVENALMLNPHIMTVTPAQPLAGTSYKGAVMVAFTFRYITEAAANYEQNPGEADG